jgi:hypothetical protein
MDNNKVCLWNYSLHEKHILGLQNTIRILINNNTQGITPTYTIDTTKDQFSLIEKCVYDIAMFQFKQLNIQFDPAKHYIDFWFRYTTPLNIFHIDCDENERAENNVYYIPLLSNVLYLNNELFPTIVTNIDTDKFLYKKFDEEDSMYLSFPRIGKVLSFNSHLCHAITNIFPEYENTINHNRYNIMVNIWDRQTCEPYYYANQLDINIADQLDNSVYNKNDVLLTLEKNNEVINDIMIDNFFNHDTIENIVYNGHNHLLYPIGNIIKEKYMNNIDKNSLFKINKYRFDGITDSPTNNSANNNTSDVKQSTISNDPSLASTPLHGYKDAISTINSYTPNCFFQRFLVTQILSKNECVSLLDEIRKSETIEEQYINYNKEIDKLSNPNAVLSFMNKILDTIVDKYNLVDPVSNTSPNINIIELYICKTNCLLRNVVFDGGLLVFNMLLSDTSNLITFEDKIKYTQNSGDLLLYSGDIMKYSEHFTNHKYVLMGKIHLE